jgi:heme-degrading monooxygenase HmoA
MVIRMWRGRTPIEKATAYEELMRCLAAPDYGAVPGLLAYYFTRHDTETEAEFLLITHWESLEAVQGFAGADYQRAKYYPEDQDFLLAFPETVEHFTVFAEG